MYYMAAFFLVTSYGVTYMEQAANVSPTVAVSTVFYAGLALMIFSFLGSLLGNTRLGRRGTMIAGMIGMIAMCFPYFLMLNTGIPILLYLAPVLLFAGTYIGFGPFYAFEAESFPTRFRESGAGYGHTIGGAFGSFAALFAAAIIARAGSVSAGWPYVATMLVIYGVLSVISTLMMKETGHGAPLRED
jgi:MFS family permease